MTFAEYLVMEKRSQESKMRSHPAFRYAQSLVDDTRQENRRIVKGPAAGGR